MAIRSEQLNPLSTTTRLSPETAERHHGAPFSEMDAIIAEMESLREGSVLPHEEVEALLEEHRREFGRA
jgi:hypothetical protein